MNDKANMNEDIKKAIEVMKAGGIILYPTDTIWGLGCDATNEAAVHKIYELKRRAENKAMLVLLDDAAKLERYLEKVPEMAYSLMRITRQATNNHIRQSIQHRQKPFGRKQQRWNPDHAGSVFQSTMPSVPQTHCFNICKYKRRIIASNLQRNIRRNKARR